MYKKIFGSVLILFAMQSLVTAQNQKLEISKIAEGVYAAIYSELRMDPIEGNSLIVITSDGVLVLDSGHSPDAARTMMAEIRKLTDKPIRYVVNSHWHDDHIFGNQAYQEAFPNVQFIAHRHTREDMEAKVIPSLKDFGVEYWKKMRDTFDSQLAKGTRSDGQPLTETQKARLQEQSQVVTLFLPKIQSLRIVLPTLTFDDKLTLHQGDREIQILNFGFGNTRGDIAVYLPKEKILATGDLLVHPVPFAYGSFLREWIEYLKKLRQMEATVIIPGHGPLMRDKDYLDTVISLLEALVSQVNDAVTRGLSLEDTKKAVNLESFRQRLAGDDPVRRGIFQDSLLREAIERTYHQVKGVTPGKST